MSVMALPLSILASSALSPTLVMSSLMHLFHIASYHCSCCGDVVVALAAVACSNDYC